MLILGGFMEKYLHISIYFCNEILRLLYKIMYMWNDECVI